MLLHDLFLTAFYALATVVNVALAAVILKASWRYLFGAPSISKPITAHVWRGSQEGVQATVQEPVHVEAVSRLDETNPSPTNPEAVLVKTVAEAEPAPQPEALPIECPKCKNEIKSKKIGVRRPTAASPLFGDVYKCEHCGVRIVVEP
jgi:hypothetical protein